MRQTLVAGNWKMHGSRASVTALLGEIVGAVPASGPEVVVCPSYVHLAQAIELCAGSAVGVGAQDCSQMPAGAFTGDVAAGMLVDQGCRWVIVGHSERRADHSESDKTVSGQASAALRAGLTPIICVGETLEQRDAGQVSEVITGQILGSIPADASPGSIVVAYEPVWAIGTGRVANAEQIGEAHELIRDLLLQRFGTAGNETRILYGGSMNPANAAEILAVTNVNGGLIGGASLKAEDFLAIYRLAAK